MAKSIIKVSGMKCDHCVKHVTKAISEIRGVKDVTVDLNSGTATFEKEDFVDINDIKQAIIKAGYSVS